MIINYNNTVISHRLLKFLHRAVWETMASLDIIAHGCPITAFPAETPRTSRQYDTEGFNGSPDLGPDNIDGKFYSLPLPTGIRLTRLLMPIKLNMKNF